MAANWRGCDIGVVDGIVEREVVSCKHNAQTSFRVRSGMISTHFQPSPCTSSSVGGMRSGDTPKNNP